MYPLSYQSFTEIRKVVIPVVAKWKEGKKAKWMSKKDQLIALFYRLAPRRTSEAGVVFEIKGWYHGRTNGRLDGRPKHKT